MSLRDFQTLMRDLYLNNDEKRGVVKTFLWLVEEVGEVAQCLNEQTLDLEHTGEELADVIAWACSVANILGIDLETEIWKKYPNLCPKCGKNPCECETA